MSFEETVTKMRAAKRKAAYISMIGRNEALLAELIRRTDFLSESATVNQRVWHVLNDDWKKHVCECGKEKVFARRLEIGYRKTCGNIKCQDSAMKNTCLGRYGVDSVMKDSNVKARYKKTNDELYGGQWLAKPEIRKKRSDVISARMRQRLPGTLVGRNGDNLIIEYPCGHTCETHKQVPYNRSMLGINPCVICFPPGQPLSAAESEVGEFISSLGFDVQTRVKFDGVEADIYVKDRNFAVEYNGLYWHSEAHKQRDYHSRKQQIMKANGIDLIYVWEDDWILLKEKVKSRIAAKLGALPNSVGARELKLKKINGTAARSFLVQNHIQGWCASTWHYGLCREDEIMAIMSFAKTRRVNGGDGTGIELTRFCCRNNFSIPGAAGKLFSAFAKEHNPVSVISYHDLCWGSNTFYDKLGFQLKATTQPGYSYLVNRQRVHRYNYRKSQLVKMGYDPNKTEREITKELKMLRIYDAGQQVWVYQTMVTTIS